MRSRLAKYAPSFWLVVLSALILIGLLVTNWTQFPTYLARVALTPTDDFIRFEFGGLQAVANQVPVSRDMEIRTVTDLVGLLDCPATKADSFRNLELSRVLNRCLYSADRDLRERLYSAEVSGQIVEFENAIQTGMAKDPGVARKIERYTHLPKSVWPEFLWLESRLRQDAADWDGKSLLAVSVIDPWIGSISASHTGSRIVCLTVANRNPRKAEIVASAVALTLQAYKQKEIRAQGYGRRGFDDQPDLLTAQRVSADENQAGLYQWIGTSSPASSHQRASASNRGNSERPHLFRALLDEPVRISQWDASVVSPDVPLARATRHQPYKSFRFIATRLPVVFIFSWVLAMTLHIVGITARSIWEASLSASAQAKVVARDEDF